MRIIQGRVQVKCVSCTRCLRQVASPGGNKYDRGRADISISTKLALCREHRSVIQACSPYQKWLSLEMISDYQRMPVAQNASFRVRQMALYHLLAVCSWASCLTSLNICFPIH